MILGLVRQLEENEGAAQSAGQRQFANIQPAEEQQAAINGIVADVKAKKPVIKLAGYAGTGKSVVAGLLGAIFEDMGLKVAYCAPTGKASGVLKRSLAANALNPSYIGTIHRMLYRPVFDAHGGLVGMEKQERLDYQLIVVDEASMVHELLAADLESFGIPILYIGDHGQLPPVGEDVGLMATPDYRLERVRRQALSNPIVALSFLLRQGGDWRKYVAEVSKKSDAISRVDAWSYMDYILSYFPPDFVKRPMGEDPLLIAHTNVQRSELNAAVRIGLQTDKVVVPGERIIVLKNAYLNGALIANGFRGQVTTMAYNRSHHHVAANIVFPDEGLGLDQTQMNRYQFGRSATFKQLDEIKGDPRAWDEVGMLCDYGYALTCHKAQGSQADHVIVRMDRGRMTDDEWRRWSYTAATRAQSKLDLIY